MQFILSAPQSKPLESNQIKKCGLYQWKNSRVIATTCYHSNHEVTFGCCVVTEILRKMEEKASKKFYSQEEKKKIRVCYTFFHPFPNLLRNLELRAKVQLSVVVIRLILHAYFSISAAKLLNPVLQDCCSMFVCFTRIANIMRSFGTYYVAVFSQ